MAAALLVCFWCNSSYISAQITYLASVDANRQKPLQMVISPDNKFAYVIASTEIQTYQRNDTTGGLTFVSAFSTTSDGTNLYYLNELSISPDGKFIYVVGLYRVFVFSRNLATGVLTDFQTLQEEDINPGKNSIAVSNNGRFIYVAAGAFVFMYERDSVTDILTQSYTANVSNSAGGAGAIILSPDNRLMYVTGGFGIGVFERDTNTGRLHFKSAITGDNYNNTGLTYANETVVSSTGKFLYTATSSAGMGALVVLAKDTVTDTLTVIQTLLNSIHPSGVNISSDGRLVFISAGVSSIEEAMMFYEVDSITGKLRYISSYKGSHKYLAKKCMDVNNKYLYTCPVVYDSIYIHRFDLFLDSIENVCSGNLPKLTPRGNYNSYLWSTGSTGSSITTSTPGLYTVTATDQNGNVYVDSVQVTFHQQQRNWLGNDTTLNVGELFWVGLVDLPNSIWYWDGHILDYNDNAIVNDGSYLGTKPLTVALIDEFGCDLSDTLNITFSSATTGDIFCYPNPFKSYTILTGSIPAGSTLEVYNSAGQVVFTLENLPGYGLAIISDNWPQGMYIARFIKNGKVVASKKIVVIN